MQLIIIEPAFKVLNKVTKKFEFLLSIKVKYNRSIIYFVSNCGALQPNSVQQNERWYKKNVCTKKPVFCPIVVIYYNNHIREADKHMLRQFYGVYCKSMKWWH